MMHEEENVKATENYVILLPNCYTHLARTSFGYRRRFETHGKPSPSGSCKNRESR